MAQELDLIATAGLTREHQDIEKVLAVMSIMADRLEHWRFIDGSHLTDVTAFLGVFANECQRALEENELFPALESKCMSHTGCLLPTLVHEHNRAESLIRNLAQAAHLYIDSGGARKDPLIDALRNLVTLYREHLWKEDKFLLSMAEKVLSQEEQVRLYRAFNMRPQIELDALADRIEQQSKQEVSHLGEVLI